MSDQDAKINIPKGFPALSCAKIRTFDCIFSKNKNFISINVEIEVAEFYSFGLAQKKAHALLRAWAL